MPRLPRYLPVGKRITYLCRPGKLSAEIPALSTAERREFLRLLQRVSRFYGFELLAYKVAMDSLECVLHHSAKRPSKRETLERTTEYYGAKVGKRVAAGCKDKISAGILEKAETNYGDLSVFNQRLKSAFSRYYSERHPEHSPQQQLWRDRYRVEVVEERPETILAACAEVEKRQAGATRGRPPARDPFCSFGCAAGGDHERRGVICSLTGKRSWPQAAAKYQEQIDQADPPPIRPNKLGRKGVFGQLSLEKLVASQPPRHPPNPHADLTPESVHMASLKKFRKRFGHTKVPLNWRENPLLASWVNARRKLRRRGKLSVASVAALDALGFDWVLPRGRNPSSDNTASKLQPDLYVWDAAWLKHYSQLQAFVAEHGHCKVPTDEDHFKLYRWVYQQRRAWRAGKLSADRRRRLKLAGVSP